MTVSESRPFGVYVHVPFCATRCGYCDFNTYTPAELGGAQPRRLAGRAARGADAGSRHASGPRRVDTVFVGGGTPSVLGGDSAWPRSSTRFATTSGWPKTPR